MNIASGITHQEIGRRLKQLREAASLRQAEVARLVTWSPAVLSRVESGEREVSRDELTTITEAIGTPEALRLLTSLSRHWREIPRPPLDHPDEDPLWQAEQVCGSLVDLRRDPETRQAFAERLDEFIKTIRHGAERLLKRDYDVAFIGSKGIGKSTAICRVTGLEVPGPENAPPTPVLEAGGGGVTICDVHLGTGHGYGLLAEPCSEQEIRAHVTDFARHIKGTRVTAADRKEGNSQGIAQEIERAIRNLSGLRVRREKGPDGKTIRRDEAKDLADRTDGTRDYVVEVLARMELHRRDRRDIWYDRASGKTPLAWLRETFEQINNGRHPDFTLPNRIDVIVDGPLLGDTDLSIRLIDTRGIDGTSTRADLERRLDEPHTLALLCSAFNDAPSAAARVLLDRAKQTGVRGLARNATLLVLPRANEALAVKDEGGMRAQTIHEGYELKAEYAAMALEPLGLGDLKIRFYNAFGDDPAQLRTHLFDSLREIQDGFRVSLQEDVASAQFLLENHENEEVRTVRRSAATMLRTCITQHGSVPQFHGHVHDELLRQIREAYPATVDATIRREGSWQNLDYRHHLGYGARQLVAQALKPAVNKLKDIADVMKENPEYHAARDLIHQTQRVQESGFDELLRKVQLIGRTAFNEAFKRDSELWRKCENEWGRGPGYLIRVTSINQEWFLDAGRRAIEHELADSVHREWGELVSRLFSLLEADELGNNA